MAEIVPDDDELIDLVAALRGQAVELREAETSAAWGWTWASFGQVLFVGLFWDRPPAIVAAAMVGLFTWRAFRHSGRAHQLRNLKPGAARHG